MQKCRTSIVGTSETASMHFYALLLLVVLSMFLIASLNDIVLVAATLDKIAATSFSALNGFLRTQSMLDSDVVVN